MDLISHVQQELEALDYYNTEDETLKQIRDDVMALIAIFLGQQHNKESGCIVGSMFNNLINFRRLSPLKGDDNEWLDITDINDGHTLFQNKRCVTVFKNEDCAYNMEAFIFEYPDGKRFITKNSIGRIDCFPYTPNPVIVPIPFPENPEEDKKCEETENP